MSRRIGIAIVIVTALAIFVFAAPLAYAVARLYQDQEVIQLEREATEASLSLVGKRIDGSAPITMPTVGHHRSLATYTADGQNIGGNGPRTADSSVMQALNGEVSENHDGGVLEVSVPVINNEHVVGIVRAASPDSAVRQRTRATWFVMSLIGAAALLLAAGVGALVARRLARPIREITKIADRLGEGDFSERAQRAGIPEVDQVADTLNATATRLDEVLSRERAFSADASHQLRTPLTGLRLQIEGALVDEASDYSAVLTESLTEIDRLEATIDDLLALARDARPPTQRLDVDELFNETYAAWRTAAQKQHRALQLKTEFQLPDVHASARAVRQAINVVVDNALKHGAGTVTLHARGSGGGLIIDVSDEGRNRIENATAIFDRRSESASGHGIGLALARSLVEAEGGRLVLRSPGPNTTFSIVFPAYKAAPAVSTSSL